MEYKQLHKFVEAINAYYAFALLLYAAALYFASHIHLFYPVFFAATPLLAAWTGYLLKTYIERRNYRQGFRIISDVMTYELNSAQRSTLRISTKLQAKANHLVVYPIGYQWTGGGDESIPKVTEPGQLLLAPLEQKKSDSEDIKVSPYKWAGSTQGKWHYWFVAFNPPVHKGDIVDIKYSQEFHDKEGIAKPILYYYVRIPMERLELNVKFPKNALPKTVTCSYVKPSDAKRLRSTSGVLYDPEKQWATWVIDKPKKGYCYSIQWQ